MILSEPVCQHCPRSQSLQMRNNPKFNLQKLISKLKPSSSTLELAPFRFLALFSASLMYELCLASSVWYRFERLLGLAWALSRHTAVPTRTSKRALFDNMLPQAHCNWSWFKKAPTFLLDLCMFGLICKPCTHGLGMLCAWGAEPKPLYFILKPRTLKMHF